MSISPTWDLFVGIFLVIGVVYGFVLQKERVFTALLALYVASMITSIWSDPIFNFFQGKSMIGSVWIQANATPMTIQIAIFGLIFILIAAKAPIGYMRSWSLVSPIEIVVYSILNSLIMIGTLYRYLSPELQQKIIEQSIFIPKINLFYNVLLVVPLVVLMVITSRKSE